MLVIFFCMLVLISLTCYSRKPDTTNASTDRFHDESVAGIGLPCETTLLCFALPSCLASFKTFLNGTALFSMIKKQVNLLKKLNHQLIKLAAYL